MPRLIWDAGPRMIAMSYVPGQWLHTARTSEGDVAWRDTDRAMATLMRGSWMCKLPARRRNMDVPGRGREISHYDVMTAHPAPDTTGPRRPILRAIGKQSRTSTLCSARNRWLVLWRRPGRAPRQDLHRPGLRTDVGLIRPAILERHDLVADIVEAAGYPGQQR